jgi:hypothetical protein
MSKMYKYLEALYFLTIHPKRYPHLASRLINKAFSYGFIRSQLEKCCRFKATYDHLWDQLSQFASKAYINQIEKKNARVQLEIL